MIDKQKSFMRRINILAGIPVRLSQIAKVAAQERPHVVPFRIVSWFTYIIEGKLNAYFAGWKKAYLGRGSRVIGTRFIEVGERVSIGRYAWIEAVTGSGTETFHPAIKIGQSCYVSERLHISAINRIEIGNDCLFGSGVYISDHNHGSYKGEIQSHPDEPPVTRRLISHGPVSIGSKVWVGDNVTIIGPVRIGDGVVVAANSVVTRDVPDNVIVAGVPAKIIKKFDSSSSSWKI